MMGSPAGIEGHTKKVYMEMLQGSPQKVLQRRLYSGYRGAYKGAYRSAYKGRLQGRL